MQHPIIAKENSALRSRVSSLLKNGYLYPGRSNIIFVCGGNAADQMRPRFNDYCRVENVEFLIFQPEFAIDHALSFNDDPFNLSDFENIIGHLSIAIVIFPEGPGSFSEAGYFSAINDLAKKSILILDQTKLGEDSFLSIGPGKLISDRTRFHPQIQMSYADPEFALIFQRIRERDGVVRRKSFPTSTYSHTDYFEKFSIVFCIFNILETATIDDVHFIVKGLFSGRADLKQIQYLASVLLGAGLIYSVGEAGEYSAKDIGKIGCTTRDGYNENRNALKVEVLNLLSDVGKINAGEADDAA